MSFLFDSTNLEFLIDLVILTGTKPSVTSFDRPHGNDQELSSESTVLQNIFLTRLQSFGRIIESFEIMQSSHSGMK